MTNILYAAPLSLYSGKARAYLDWKAVAYKEELSRPEVFRDIIVPNVGRPVIPVLQTGDGSIIQDTTLIIDHFESVAAGPSIYPKGPLQKLVALLFEIYGDEWLVIPAMHYRWHYNEDWIYAEFGKVTTPDGTVSTQRAAGTERGSAFKALVPLLGIDETTIPAIEASYESLLLELDRHFGDHEYLLGSRPCIGDFGLIGPLYAHLYRDPESGKLMKRISPHVASWVERMVDVKEPLSGEFLSGDVVPETLLPVLRRMMSEMLPWLQNVATAFAEWVSIHPGETVPRAVGLAPFRLNSSRPAGRENSVVQGQRLATPYSLWMLQRALDHYLSLGAIDKIEADIFLERVHGLGFRNFSLLQRVRFSNHVVSLDNN